MGKCCLHLFLAVYGPIFLILAGSEDIKAWMRSNFDQILRLTTKLVAIVRLKIDFFTFSRVLFIQSILNLQVTRTCIISPMCSNFGQIGSPTSTLSAL